MSTPHKRYRLLKDLPYARTGVEFRWHNSTGGYAPFSLPNETYESDMRMSLSREYVENNLLWFEPIPDPQPEPELTADKKWTDDDLIDFSNFVFRHPNKGLFMGKYVEEWKLHAEQDLYNARKDAFEAGGSQGNVGLFRRNRSVSDSWSFKTFDDYIKSIRQQQAK